MNKQLQTKFMAFIFICFLSATEIRSGIITTQVAATGAWAFLAAVCSQGMITCAPTLAYPPLYCGCIAAICGTGVLAAFLTIGGSMLSPV